MTVGNNFLASFGSKFFRNYQEKHPEVSETTKFDDTQFEGEMLVIEVPSEGRITEPMSEFCTLLSYTARFEKWSDGVQQWRLAYIKELDTVFQYVYERYRSRK